MNTSYMKKCSKEKNISVFRADLQFGQYWTKTSFFKSWIPWKECEIQLTHKCRFQTDRRLIAPILDLIHSDPFMKQEVHPYFQIPKSFLFFMERLSEIGNRPFFPVDVLIVQRPKFQAPLSKIHLTSYEILKHDIYN